MRLIRIGELNGGGQLAGVVELIWQNAGFSAQAFADIHQLIWENLFVMLCVVRHVRLLTVILVNYSLTKIAVKVALGCLTKLTK